MKHSKITVFSISDPTGTTAPSAGANGELGVIGLKSEIMTVSADLQMQISALSISGGGTWSQLNQYELQTSQVIAVTQSANRVYVGVTVTGGPVTILLPPLPSDLQEILVKHETGNVVSNIITISGNGNTIDNFPTHIIDTDDAGYHYIYANSQWRIF